VKVLLDQDVPRRAAAVLRERGVDAVHASEVGLGSARDADVVAWCRAQRAIAVTLDADIHALIALSGLTTPSTIRIRVQGLNGAEMARLLVDVLEGQEMTSRVLPDRPERRRPEAQLTTERVDDRIHWAAPPIGRRRTRRGRSHGHHPAGSSTVATAGGNQRVSARHYR
jgi:predicted nuclease of predicted toxin-antitoxin system